MPKSAAIRIRDREKFDKAWDVVNRSRARGKLKRVASSTRALDLMADWILFREADMRGRLQSGWR